MFHPPLTVKLTVSIRVVHSSANLQGGPASKLSPRFQRALILPRLRTWGDLRVGPVSVAYVSPTHALVMEFFSITPKEKRKLGGTLKVDPASTFAKGCKADTGLVEVGRFYWFDEYLSMGLIVRSTLP
jgi:hypothetical protein